MVVEGAAVVVRAEVVVVAVVGSRRIWGTLLSFSATSPESPFLPLTYASNPSRRLALKSKVYWMVRSLVRHRHPLSHA